MKNITENRMNEMICSLRSLKVNITIEKNSICNKLAKEPLDHGSHEQTRDMLFESIFENATNHLDVAAAQLEILNRNLY